MPSATPRNTLTQEENLKLKFNIIKKAIAERFVFDKLFTNVILTINSIFLTLFNF